MVPDVPVPPIHPYQSNIATTYEPSLKHPMKTEMSLLMQYMVQIVYSQGHLSQPQIHDKHLGDDGRGPNGIKMSWEMYGDVELNFRMAFRAGLQWLVWVGIKMLLGEYF